MNLKKVKKNISSRHLSLVGKVKEHQAKGEYKFALAILAVLINEHPKREYHVMMADCFFRLNDPRSALKVLDLCNRDRELTPEESYGLAHLCYDAGYGRRAIKYAHDALGDDIKLADIYDIIAKSYVLLQQSSQAQYFFEMALRADPEHKQATCGLAILQAGRGNYELAYNTIKPVLDGTAITALPFAYICLGRGTQDEAIPVLSAALVGANIINQTKILFSTGRIYDSVGLYETAWKIIGDANRLSNKIYNKENYSVQTEHLMKFYPSLNKPKNDYSPIFIIGMPRSGTTLVEQILSRHPEINAGGEMITLGRIANKVNGINFELLGYEYMKEMSWLSELRTTNKNPINYLLVGAIAEMFGEPKILHCKRDRMDNSVSIFFQQFDTAHEYAYDWDNIQHNYDEYLKLMAHWRLLGVSMLDVHYEELVDSQEAVTRDILSHCGVSWNQDCMTPEKSSRLVYTASQQQVGRPVYKTSVGRFSNYAEYLTDRS